MSKLQTHIFNTTYQFGSIKEVLNKASDLRSGDIQAGIGAADTRERVAAKIVLSEFELGTLRHHPSVPYEECELSRMFEDSLDEKAYKRVAGMTVGQFREWIVDETTTGTDILAISPGLTPEMVSSVAKIMSNMDLVTSAKKIRVVVKCNATLGLPGRISSRLQPNHPRDEVAGILAAIREGLSYGCGDAVLGINPATETVESTHEILSRTKDFMRQYSIPTQNCVLAHITTQIRALERKAPVDLFFQSLAGSEKANRNFGISLKLIDEAHDMIRREGTAEGPNVMYFETGQGTALSSNAHYGADQMTMEARTYGFARRYKPFLVNSVVGFIGPEYLYNGKQIRRAGLEDHFMGKLSGISMGCDACYTNHAVSDQDDQEDLELLLATAGVNFLMAIPVGDDVMLNYETTSFHNNATLRSLLDLKPTPEFEAWLVRMGLWRNGRLTARAGDPSVFNSQRFAPSSPRPKEFNA
ncbi:MAG: ethanolamine ammonia-lyase subunit EutB [Bdellovibrionales bacterium]|nr:ethanolamine ammonia-lyase subunit EutB [Bdellovibrionales bacterium]